MKKYLPHALILLFACLLAAGLISGENTRIFRNAVVICLSCIGIG